MLYITHTKGADASIGTIMQLVTASYTGKQRLNAYGTVAPYRFTP